jgi:two-component system chemotaxis response regulator CheB
MPEMDGVTLLEKHIARHHIPTVMVTSISMQESDQVLRALNLGAVDYIQKPSFQELAGMSELIREKIKIATHATFKKAGTKPAARAVAIPAGAADLSKIIAIGASTGGVQALEAVLTRLPEKIPPIVIVQHIPAVFSAAFARRLNDLCPFEVREAKDGDVLREGLVLIAPGGTQMSLVASGSTLQTRVTDAPPVNRHKPSVDVLFDSVAELLGPKAVGAILTGMGADGARGLLKMRQAGARTIAQNEETCVVFGMPREAIARGGAEKVCALDDVPGMLMQLLAARKAA